MALLVDATTAQHTRGSEPSSRGSSRARASGGGRDDHRGRTRLPRRGRPGDAARRVRPHAGRTAPLPALAPATRRCPPGPAIRARGSCSPAGRRDSRSSGPSAVSGTPRSSTTSCRSRTRTSGPLEASGEAAGFCVAPKVEGHASSRRPSTTPRRSAASCSATAPCRSLRMRPAQRCRGGRCPRDAARRPGSALRVRRSVRASEGVIGLVDIFERTVADLDGNCA